MQLSPLTAVSPVDGRYHTKTRELAAWFSEYALFGYRVRVEIEYFIALAELPLPQLKAFDHSLFPQLRKVYEDFSVSDAQAIKEIEKTINHDVKAVEYFVKQKLEELGAGQYTEFVHFGLTSQDINNTATPLLLKEYLLNEYLHELWEVFSSLKEKALAWYEFPMLARTHGQPASPTRLGKEIGVYIARLEKQIELLQDVPHSGKFGGATGNFNAHQVAYPEYDWHNFADTFLNEYLGLERSYPTTQIEHYDNMAALFDTLKRINTILLDLCKDVWTYISMDYFKQRINEDEVGSSAMPHKVNPIDFENAEGNLGMANALFEHLSAKLPVSRLQRDLTDSTVTRNIGVPMAHTTIAFKAILKGIDKLVVNDRKLQEDLEDNWVVVAEALQTILRREGYPQPYETLKTLTRQGKKMDQESFHSFIDTLKVSDAVKDELKAVSPFNYTGV